MTPDEIIAYLKRCCVRGTVVTATKEAFDELDRFRREYELFENDAPPDVPRRQFVEWCFGAWEKQQAAEAAKEADDGS